MKKYLLLASVLVLGLSVSACSTATKEKLGLAKKAPNEFMVAPKAPLVLPPEYDLRPVTDAATIVNETNTEGMSEAEKAVADKIEKGGK